MPGRQEWGVIREDVKAVQYTRAAWFGGGHSLPRRIGFAVTGTGNYRDPFDRIVRESSTYYLLAYTSTNNKIDGKYRRTQINVKRPGVETFYRPGYMARRP